MSGIDRYFSVLSLFSEEKSAWTVLEISLAVDVPTSTVYRTIRELARVNMLELAYEGHYRLGAAFVEFDRRARLTDPLVQVIGPMLSELVQQVGVPCVSVLARLYGDTVMCVADARSPGSSVHTSYERGRPRPLTRGATSKAILAQLTTRRLKKLLVAKPSDHTAAATESDFRCELAAIRRNGYCVSHGEVDRGIVGVAVPVFLTEQALVASLSVMVDEASLDESLERRLVLLLVSSVALAKEQLGRRLPAVPPAVNLKKASKKTASG
jgi:DNA-binding IclR family transcriptional regulator